MSSRIKKEYLGIVILIIFVLGIFIFYYQNTREHLLKVEFLDIGQGDSVYIEAPNGAQLLVDGGRGSKVLSALASVMPYGDKSIDVVIGTHPDADHIGGLVNVLDSYQVGQVIESGGQSNSQIYKKLEGDIDAKHIPHIYGRAGMRIMLDPVHNVYFDILYPDRDVSYMETNDGSIVGKLVYGSTSVMLTADSPISKEFYLMNKDKEVLKANVLKLGHHGSRTSSSTEYLKAVSPQVAIISAGLNNQYGHPHPEVLDKLQSLHIPYLATYKEGTIECLSNAIAINCK
jgi:competence protein ComEC